MITIVLLPPSFTEHADNPAYVAVVHYSCNVPKLHFLTGAFPCVPYVCVWAASSLSVGRLPAFEAMLAHESVLRAVLLPMVVSKDEGSGAWFADSDSVARLMLRLPPLQAPCLKLLLQKVHRHVFAVAKRSLSRAFLGL